MAGLNRSVGVAFYYFGAGFAVFFPEVEKLQADTVLAYFVVKTRPTDLTVYPYGALWIDKFHFHTQYLLDRHLHLGYYLETAHAYIIHFDMQFIHLPVQHNSLGFRSEYFAFRLSVD
jgi:hypothetical protein